MLSLDEITFCVMARAEINEAGRHIAAGIGLARPRDLSLLKNPFWFQKRLAGEDHD